MLILLVGSGAHNERTAIHTLHAEKHIADTELQFPERIGHHLLRFGNSAAHAKREQQQQYTMKKQATHLAADVEARCVPEKAVV